MSVPIRWALVFVLFLAVVAMGFVWEWLEQPSWSQLGEALGAVLLLTAVVTVIWLATQ